MDGTASHTSANQEEFESTEMLPETQSYGCSVEQTACYKRGEKDDDEEMKDGCVEQQQHD